MVKLFFPEKRIKKSKTKTHQKKKKKKKPKTPQYLPKVREDEKERMIIMDTSVPLLTF